MSDGITFLDTFTGVSSIIARPIGHTVFDIDLTSGGITGALSITANGPMTVSLAANSIIGGALTFTGESSAQSLTLRSGVAIGKALAATPFSSRKIPSSAAAPPSPMSRRATLSATLW